MPTRTYHIVYPGNSAEATQYVCGAVKDADHLRHREYVVLNKPKDSFRHFNTLKDIRRKVNLNLRNSADANLQRGARWRWCPGCIEPHATYEIAKTLSRHGE